jgi:lipoate---protein ligase
MVKILHDGIETAEVHMQKDRDLVMNGSNGPLLRFYDWDGFCATVGYTIKADEYLCLDRLSVAKRPTGGGILFHGNDFAFSLFFPRGHQWVQGSVEEVCRRINGTIKGGLLGLILPEADVESFFTPQISPFCMARATAFDLLWSGYKIGGCAQRWTRYGLLHQVSIFLTTPSWDKVALCTKDQLFVEKMKRTSKSIQDVCLSSCTLGLIKEAIMNSFSGV